MYKVVIRVERTEHWGELDFGVELCMFYAHTRLEIFTELEPEKMSPNELKINLHDETSPKLAKKKKIQNEPSSKTSYSAWLLKNSSLACARDNLI